MHVVAEKTTRPIVKRSVTLHGHRTSFSIEQPFFDEIVAAAHANGRSLAALVSEIDETRPREVNLSSALRLYVLERLKAERDAVRGND